MAQTEQQPDETDEEFWARVDPYDDRLSRELPRWSCVVFVAVLLALVVAAYLFLT
ncbi:MAG: hypothetical protein V4696_11950 [Pseudomonadota bacterium]